MSAHDWIELLRGACAAHNQREIASRIGYSTAVISQVLNGVYKGDLKRVQAAVEGALAGHVVDCPVIGDLPRQRCIEHQRAPFATTNPMRVQLYRACKACTQRITGDLK